MRKFLFLLLLITCIGITITISTSADYSIDAWKKMAIVKFPLFADGHGVAHVHYVNHANIMMPVNGDGYYDVSIYQGKDGIIVGAQNVSWVKRPADKQFELREIVYILSDYAGVDIYEVVSGITRLEHDGEWLALAVEDCNWPGYQIVCRLWLNPEDSIHYWDVYRTPDGRLVVSVPGYYTMPTPTPAPAEHYHNDSGDGGGSGGDSSPSPSEPEPAPDYDPIELPPW